MRFEMWQQVFDNGLFDCLALGRGFDDEVGGTKVCQCRGGGDPPQRRVHVGFGNFSAPGLTGHIALHDLHRLVQRVLTDVGEHHVIAGQRHHMRDSVAHLACADDADCLDFHAAFL